MHKTKATLTGQLVKEPFCNHSFVCTLQEEVIGPDPVYPGLATSLLKAFRKRNEREGRTGI